MSIASEFLQYKAEFKEKHLRNVNVKGRLSKHVDFWRNVLNVSDTDSNIIFSGYIVPYFNFPIPSFVTIINQQYVILNLFPRVLKNC